MSGRLKGKVAIVTGGAGAIGSATVRRFVAEGARVAIVDVVEPSAELERSVASEGIFVRCDHRSDTQCQGAVARTLERWGRIDILFNNAGQGTFGEIESHAADGLLEDLRTSLIGPWLMTRAAAPHLRSAAREYPDTGACVLFTSSNSGLIGKAGQSTYTAAKHGVIGLVRSLALELGAHNIRVNAICPGGVHTPGKAASLSGWRAAGIEASRQKSPLKRLPTTDDIAAAALFLCSDDARAISGQALLVDCGANSH